MGVPELRNSVQELTQYLNAQVEDPFSSSLVDSEEPLGGVPSRYLDRFRS